MKYIGVDFGDARVGIASSDPTGTIANADCVLKVAGIDDAARKTAARASELGGQAFVLGLPVTSAGTEEYRVERTRRFAALLKEHSGLPVCFCDERFTSAEALRYLSEGAVFGSKRKKVLDAVAAQIILQSYLDAKPGEPHNLIDNPKLAEITKPDDGSMTNEDATSNEDATPDKPPEAPDSTKLGDGSKTDENTNPNKPPKAPNIQGPAEITKPDVGGMTNENTTPNENAKPNEIFKPIDNPKAPKPQRPTETTKSGDGGITDLPQCGGGHR